MQGFDHLHLVMSIDELLKIIFLYELTIVGLILFIILLFVEKFILFQVQETKICTILAFILVFAIIIAVDIPSVKI
jgi:hypothetical protein